MGVVATTPFVNTGAAVWSETAVLTTGRWITTMLTLAGVSLATLVIALRFGAEDLSFPEITHILSQALQRDGTDSGSISAADVILLQVRLPRVLLGYLVGG